jgi:hypothetical protein
MILPPAVSQVSELGLQAAELASMLLGHSIARPTRTAPPRLGTTYDELATGSLAKRASSAKDPVSWISH